MKNKITSMKLTTSTLKRLKKMKEHFDFDTYDSLIQALINSVNTEMKENF